MECPANDSPDLDDCRALNPRSYSSTWSACFTNRRQSQSRRASTSSTPPRVRSSLNLVLVLLCSLALFVAFGPLPVQASVLPTDVSQPRASFDVPLSHSAFSDIAHDDRFIASAQQGRGDDARPYHVDLTFPSNGDIFQWIQDETRHLKNGDALESQAFLDALYQRLSVQRRSALAEATPEAASSSSGLRFWKRATSSGGEGACKEKELEQWQKAVYGLLIPILVVLSGLFAGLTLGYMSLDETQLQVLSLQGTPKQKMYAEKIMPIRKDGHLLLTTLLIANMITNETLPIIADPLLGGGVQAVIVSIVLVVIFAELIPQSVCSRYGLAIGAKLAPLTRVVMLILWPIAYPVSRVLHWTLGPHHGIVYRRSELKELVNMHAATAGRGDLNNDTVTIVGGALDLQEKVVKQAMTPIDNVFMISIDSKLGYETLQQIVSSGHSRIPVYQEIEIPVNRARGGSGTLTPIRGGFLSALSRKASNTQSKTSIDDQRTLEGSLSTDKDLSAVNAESQDSTATAGGAATTTTIKRKKIIGALLVKQCVLLDPEDETPVRDMVINALPTVPADEPLLNLLNVFQEGRSHLAIVSSRTRRFSPGSFVDIGNENDPRKTQNLVRSGTAARIEDLGNIDEEKQLDDSAIKKSSFWSRHLRRHHHDKHKSNSLDLPPEALEDDVDAGAVATEMAQRDVPIGIITLEDVLEELIGEEILDEYDSEVEQNFAQLSPPPSPGHKEMVDKKVETPSDAETLQLPGSILKLPTSPKIALPRFKLGRSASQKETDVSAAPAYDNASVPPTPVIESSAEVPATKETGEKNEGVHFPFDVSEPQGRAAVVRESGVTSRPSSRPGSRPVSPGPTTALSGSEDAALVAPRANKPVVIRHQAPDGTIATAIVGEGLLRGRTTTLASERIASGSGDVSRSNTPSGTRVSRFKSTPLPGSVPGTPVTATAPRAKAFGKPEVGSAFAEEEAVPVAVASPEELESDDKKKQLGGDSDDTDTL
ncbi:related to MAM3 - protein required for normal mitochondrial morphology [Ustilago trichophora]|uniref:Related to MAM3 - protein required for normal mitochondrial morphology n=1 Tax=Ustilago trichophora TaxID=86804 RepID=A0A5C3E744_9BASI|nr:related to MAM3 - protein required for normal mitochondrial morphology [Ustilago trichophora]